MTDREWIFATLAHQETGKIPYNFLFCPPAAAALRKHLGAEDLAEALSLPIRMGYTRSIKPLYASPSEYGPTCRDEYGVTWTTSAIDRGAPTGNPLAGMADLAGYRFPEAGREYRFEHLAEWTAANEDRFRAIWVGDLWERAAFLRGMEELLLDVATQPAFVEGLLRGIADHILATMDILLERFEFECVCLSDDYGSQHGMLISPAHWRRLVKPLVAEIFARAKAAGRVRFLHSCGNIAPIVGDLIEIGLDILHPIQPEAMDIVALKRDFGRDLTFCGGLRTQDLLPFGTPRQVRDEVKRLKEVMGKGGGYILEPGITVQADVPVENIVAMVEEAAGSRIGGFRPSLDRSAGL